nr:drug efflux system protein MdtG [Klebsiella pneumoniae]
MISLFFTTTVIQLCNGSIGPILALFIKSMAPDSNNIAFLAGMIAAVPGVSALISAPRLGKLGDRIGTSRILLATLCCAVVMFFAMSFVTTRCNWVRCVFCSALPMARCSRRCRPYC